MAKKLPPARPRTPPSAAPRPDASAAERFVSAGAEAPAGRRAARAARPEGAPTTRYERADGEVLNRTTVYLPATLHRELKVYCAQQGRDLSSVVSELVAGMLGGR